MLVNLAYGRTGLEVELPDDLTTVIEPTYVPGLPDQEGPYATRSETPWAEGRLSGGWSSPASRSPSPSATLLVPCRRAHCCRWLLRELAHVPSDQVTIMIATGHSSEHAGRA